MEIPFSPGGVSRDFRIKSCFFQMIPESVDIRDADNQPTPASHRLTLFQIEDRRWGVLSTKGGETCVLSTIEKPHAQNISVNPHGLRHVDNPESHRGNLFHRRPPKQ